jgi:hypothetical protein
MWNPACTVEEREHLGKSDGGSAFDQFLAGIAKVRSLGDPLIKLLAFYFLASTVATSV